ncbi:MAG TPA: acyl-CoA dehydrogenase family protein [Solirubrobacteraceae bacterium]|nr:acyl-CoA dehydrogenase family protein [Solirubrobacteraceae bacterium]
MSDPLDLHLTERQRALYRRTLTLATDTLAGIAAAGEPDRVNRPLVRALGEHGLLARLLAAGGQADAGRPPEEPAGSGPPEEPAGSGPPEGPAGGVSAIDLCLIREALARGCTEAETAFALQGLGAHPILTAGAPELRARWIPPVVDGSAVAAFALTEPGAGSDPAALSLRAERDGDGWRLAGEKLWISNAPEADIYTVFARTDPDARGARGLTAFAIPGDAPGLRGEPRQLLSPHAIGSLTFDDVPAGPEQVLGAVGEGFGVAMRTLDLFRPSVGAFAIGMARAALGLATGHALRRRTFGRPLSEHQAVAHRLAQLHAETEAARLLVHRAAIAHDRGAGSASLAAMAKLLATEVAQAAVDAAVQFHGAAALERGHPLEHLYREVRAPRIYEGASEIQREIIARAMFRAAAGGSESAA